MLLQFRNKISLNKIRQSPACLFAGSCTEVSRRCCRVLIHAAAGGIGLMAMQLASSAGAEVLVTAGSASKRGALRRLGATHAACSRSVTFVTELTQACSCIAALDAAHVLFKLLVGAGAYANRISPCPGQDGA